MLQHNLAVLSRVDEKKLGRAMADGQLDRLREDTYSDASILLLSASGLSLRTFVPVTSIWEQPLYHTHGVVFGAEDPALFMFAFGQAKAEQVDRIVMEKINGSLLGSEYHLEGKIDGVQFSAYASEPSSSSAWLKDVNAGVFRPDCVLYSLAHNKGLLHEEEKEIITDLKKYALCVLKVFTD